MASLVFTNVGVFCRNSGGEPEIVLFRVTSTQEQYDLGEHLDAAKEAAEEQGFEDCSAFDENEPAGKCIKLSERTDVEAIDA